MHIFINNTCGCFHSSENITFRHVHYASRAVLLPFMMAEGHTKNATLKLCAYNRYWFQKTCK
jgi:hypothetical protein